MAPILFSHDGHCPICAKPATFAATQNWFRDFLLCSGCGSIPRERALMIAIDQWRPDWRNLTVHESSPGGRGVSVRLAKECKGYSWSHYFEGVAPGALHPSRGERCENLEALTFPDASFDLVVSQDVMEHIFEPDAAFAEIARVLKPGGMHIFTAPLVNKARASERRASRRANGDVQHHFEPEYHGNPVDPKGSLVTMNWGYDIVTHIFKASGMHSIIMQIDDIDRGVRAEFIEVVVSMKSGIAS